MESPGGRGGGGGEGPSRPFDEELELDELEADELEVDFEPLRRPAPAAAGPRLRRPTRATARRHARRPPRAGAPRAAQDRRSETMARVAVAVPWIAFALAIVAVGGIPFALAMAGFACIGMAELFRMAQRYRPLTPAAYVAAVALVIAAYYGSQYQIVIVLVATFPVLFAVAASRGSREGTTGAMAITLLAVIWIALPFAHAVLLRRLPLHGGALVIDVLVGTFVADTAAYASGRMFGRHPLARRLSPSKTLEGLAAGFVGGTLGLWFAGLYQNWLSGADALVMGMCVAAVAPLGDLFSSLVKRDLGVKDTGNVFGPHGGLLDRLDALLFTIVVGYYLAVAFVY